MVTPTPGRTDDGATTAAHAEVTVEQVDRLPAADVTDVLGLLARATGVDGVAPLSEHVLLHLRQGGQEPGRHLLVRDRHAGGTAVVAYAHLDPTDSVDGPSAELVVDPDHRRRGHGRRLVTSLLELSQVVADGRLRLWAHGEAPDAGALAQAMGFDRVRELWQMRRSLYAALPRVQVPAGVVLRTYEPQDAEAVLAVNAAAFVDHPEQGRWTRADLDARLREDWFDARGLFLAVRADGTSEDGELLAFHWTKVHGATRHDDHGGPGPDGAAEPGQGTPGRHAHEAIGEVYVVGVSPAAQGRGLGRLVTLVGLGYLRGRGLNQAMLYVDADNEAAVRTYQGLGFARWDVDVQFRRQV